MGKKQVLDQNKIQVFYDGACGLCAREINHYKKIAPNGIFQWIDVMEDDELIKDLGYTKEQALMALHARDTEQNMHTGVDAFIQIWGHIPRWKYLAFFVGLPGIRHVGRVFYKAFAAWRFKKLGYGTCQINQNSPS